MNAVKTATPAAFTPGDVTVILSTFNGSAFLQQQLDSLYAQSYPNVNILVRDDGSSDTTRDILNRDQSAGRITLLAGHDNLGAARSFFELLQHAAATETDFVAFCYQDDVWLAEKLARAVAALSGIRDERAAMVCTRLEIVDADLAHEGFTPTPGKIGFGNALVENIAIGCSIVLNRKAVDLISRNLPARVLVHDWWCYLVVSCFGHIIFDSEPCIKYRQHGSNVFGAARSNLDRLRRNMRRFAGDGEGRYWQSEQASAFLATFENRIPAVQRRILDRVVGAKSSGWRRMRLALTRDIWRQKPFDDLAWRFLVLVNRF